MQNETFWATVVQFIGANLMLDPQQVGPIVDYIYHRRFQRQGAAIVNGRVQGGEIAEPEFTMKGRTVDSLLRQVNVWHRQLAQAPRGMKHVTWPSCGIAGFSRIEGTEGNRKIVTLRELQSSAELFDEGRRLHHCVGSYVHSCSSGRCAIYSLRVDEGFGEERRLTVEVLCRNRQIVQARGRHNRMATEVEQRIIRGWAQQTGLQILGYVFPQR